MIKSINKIYSVSYLPLSLTSLHFTTDFSPTYLQASLMKATSSS